MLKIKHFVCSLFALPKTKSFRDKEQGITDEVFDELCKKPRFKKFTTNNTWAVVELKTRHGVWSGGHCYKIEDALLNMGHHNSYGRRTRKRTVSIEKDVIVSLLSLGDNCAPALAKIIEHRGEYGVKCKNRDTKDKDVLFYLISLKSSKVKDFLQSRGATII